MITKVKKHFNLIYFTIFVLVWLFLFWKCRYGYGNVDEVFYLAIPLRILKGDKYLINEWNLSQLSSIPLIPAMKLHMLLFGSTTGIILHFRYLFTLVWGLSSLYIFFMLKGISRTGAAISSILYLLYTPFGIMALSYNSMGIMFLTASLVTISSKYSYKPLILTLSGGLFACSVLCCPLLLITYIIFSLVSAYHSIRKTGSQITLKWKYITLGAVCIFIVFCFIVITPISNKVEYLKYTIPNIINDPSHYKAPLPLKIYYYFYSIFFSNWVSPYVFLSVLVILLLCRFTNLNKNVLFALLCIILIIYQISFLINDPYLNFIMFAPGILSLFCVIKSDNPTIRSLFYYFQLPGILYSFFLNITSNQLFYAISSASTVCTVAAFMIITIHIKSLMESASRRKSNYLVYVVTMMIILLQFFSEAYLRYTSVFWEKSMKEQTVLMDRGAEKGLLVTQEKYDYYTALYNDTEFIRESDQIKSVLFYSVQIIPYIDTDKDFSTYAAWIESLDQQTINKLVLYYSINPDKLPDVIYAPETTEGLDVFKSMGYKEEYSNMNIYMLIKE